MSLPILLLALVVGAAVVRPALGADACPPVSCPSPAASSPAPAGDGARASGDPAPALAPVPVNRASAEDLQRLPGIGPRKAAALVEARSARPFRRASDLRRVKGFGAKTVQRLAPLLVFD